MIYGDNPRQMNQGSSDDALGLNTYTYAPSAATIMQSGNLYAYGMSNPILYLDPSGLIAVTTLILIGSAVIGLIAAGTTAYQSHKYTGQIDWANTIVMGLSWFMMAYTLGMSAYSIYLSYCHYNGLTPVTEINFKSNASVATGSNMSVSYTVDGKISGQMNSRGWTSKDMNNVIQDPYTTRAAVNKATGNPTTAYYNQAGDYVVRDNVTGSIVQISHVGDINWIPDSTIVNPYRPR